MAKKDNQRSMPQIRQKTIIVILCIIIVILVVCVAMLSITMLKEETKLAISDKTLEEGDPIVVVLTDTHGIGLTNATINVKLTDENGVTIDEDVTTDSKGNAKLKVNESGKYTVECTFKGEGKYSDCSLSENIEVENATAKVVTDEQTSTTDHSGKYAPDGSIYPEYGPEVDQYGVTREYAIANNWNYIEIKVDGDNPGEYEDVSGYFPYDPVAGCWHT